jgi:hypothetical protein
MIPTLGDVDQGLFNHQTAYVILFPNEPGNGYTQLQPWAVNKDLIAFSLIYPQLIHPDIAGKNIDVQIFQQDPAPGIFLGMFFNQVFGNG